MARGELSVAEAAGFAVVRMESSVLRRQKGRDVEGLLVVLEALGS